MLTWPVTANITGYSVYHGLVTSLDTLCAQAYGSGRRQLVGLQLQRMVYFLMVITLPIGIIWLNGEAILKAIVPEQETAELAGLYLRIILLGAPGYACFEAGKRYMQAQGLFDANLYVLFVCAPLNVFLNWLFVWQFNWGFVGAPIAVAVTDNLLPMSLFLYVYFIDGRQCWGGFSRAALKNWLPMVKLALPGLIMVLAEFLAFEILTLAASHISGAHLAAQSVLSTIAATAYQLPFPMSIAASTRIANLIGATLTDAAKTAARVSIFAALIIGATNITILFSARHAIPYLFTKDPEVAHLVALTLPLCIAFQVFDALAAVCNGILRGLGRQEVGGYVNLFAYYAIAMPISFGTGFGWHWDLNGLWLGPAIALSL
jgi:putative MATE family efflux protein